MTPALELERLEVPFGEAAGLVGISLAVGAGERIAIVGASGAGKTSLLRTVAGLAASRGGRVLMAGRDVTGVPAERRDSVYLQQAPLLFPHLTVAQNVGFPLRLRGVARPELAARVAEALAAVRLGGLASRMPHTLSGGQRHRVALARAVVARPALLLLDEPLAALDPTLRTDVRDSLVAVQAAYGPALLLVTHDFDEAAVVADRVGVLLDRRLAQLAPPAELMTYPATLAVARFLGGFIEVEGQVRGGVFESVLGCIRPGRLHAADGPAVGVIRSDGLARETSGVPARVRRVRALPARLQVTVSLGDIELELSLQAAGAPEPGEELRLAPIAGLATVFPRPDREP